MRDPRAESPHGPDELHERYDFAQILGRSQRPHGHKSRAAALLGPTRFQLYTRLKRYHIQVLPD